MLTYAIEPINYTLSRGRKGTGEDKIPMQNKADDQALEKPS
jgi:hypothetical protein